MEFLIGFVVLVVVLVVPIMIGARMVDARNTGFGHALVAVIILAILSSGVAALAINEFIAFIISAALGAMVLAGVLGTTFLRGLAISVIASVIQVVALIALVMVMGSASADEYDFEIGVSYDRTQLDAQQTIVTSGETIFNSNDVDTDNFGVSGSWYFSGLSDDKGPRARAAFVDRASVLRFGYGRSEVSFATSIVSSDPLFPSLDAEFDSEGDSYALSARYVWRENGWFANAGVVSSNASIGGAIDESIDATGWTLGFGKYIFDTTSIAVAVSEADDDSADATTYALSFAHLGDIGEQWQYAIDAGYSQTDGDFGFDVDTWSAALSLYPSRDFEFGVGISQQDSDNEFIDNTGYEGFVSWFVSPRVVLAARYRVDDVDYFGNASIPSAETSSDTDQDSFGLSVAVRF